ncbi:DUF6207 family protein [Streptomyces sp. NPDC059168]|uniref:DUF6207 family protein n=1 Tax=Streptomyces sp. NPDC059168 TaxID=3346753 RepID=UPI00369BA08B
MPEQKARSWLSGPPYQPRAGPGPTWACPPRYTVLLSGLVVVEHAAAYRATALAFQEVLAARWATATAPDDEDARRAG